MIAFLGSLPVAVWFLILLGFFWGLAAFGYSLGKEVGQERGFDSGYTRGKKVGSAQAWKYYSKKEGEINV